MAPLHQVARLAMGLVRSPALAAGTALAFGVASAIRGLKSRANHHKAAQQGPIQTSSTAPSTELPVPAEINDEGLKSIKTSAVASFSQRTMLAKLEAKEAAKACAANAPGAPTVLEAEELLEHYKSQYKEYSEQQEDSWRAVRDLHTDRTDQQRKHRFTVQTYGPGDQRTRAVKETFYSMCTEELIMLKINARATAACIWLVDEINAATFKLSWAKQAQAGGGDDV